MFRSTLTAIALAMTAAAPLAAQDLPGYDQLLVAADHRAGALKTALWYPAARKTYKSQIGDNPVFFGTEVYVGAALPDGKLPLVILSHGSGGNIDAMGWLAAPLAAKGALVVGVNHPGSTSGDSSPRRSIRQSERSADITALINALLADPDFGPRIDASDITVLGFSMGGFTALSMTGITLDRAAYQAYCTTYGAQAQDCVFYGKGGVDMANLPAQFSTPAPEPRVRRVIGVDAAFGHAMTEASLAQVSVPVHLIALGAPGAVPPAVNVGQSGSALDSRIAGATLDHIEGAHHFSFLAACKPGAGKLLEEEGEDPICDDTGLRPRADVHAEALALISGYIFGAE